MEISPNLLQDSLEGTQPLLTWAAAISGAYLALTSVRIRIRRVPAPSSLGSLVGGLGLALAFSGMVRASEASGRSRSPRQVVRSESPPWSEPGGFTPPRLPGSTTRSAVHPAIHRSSRASADRLFPRAGRSIDDATRARADRSRAMSAHPAGKSLERYVVKHGDSLWDIAARVLGTTDARRIARFWPRIHRINRDVLGRDPNHIFPGQLLRLPDETR